MELLNYDKLRQNFCDNFCVGTNTTFHRNLFNGFRDEIWRQMTCIDRVLPSVIQHCVVPERTPRPAEMYFISFVQWMNITVLKVYYMLRIMGFDAMQSVRWFPICLRNVMSHYPHMTHSYPEHWDSRFIQNTGTYLRDNTLGSSNSACCTHIKILN